MKISFIIAHYNKPLYMLRECIESIFALNLLEEERQVIIVDDGSNEPIDKVLSGFESSLTVIHQRNQGPSIARNTGIDVAVGDYIQFVDSDDTLIPDIYERIISHVREKQMDMLMFHFTHGEVKQKNKKLSKCYRGEDFLVSNNLRAATCCYIFRKEILRGLRFQPGIFLEDALFTPLLIMNADSLYVIKDQAYFYRQSEGTTMNRRDEQFIEKRLNDSFFVLQELQRYAYQLTSKSQKAMQRCIDQQVMGYIYFLYILKRNKIERQRRIAQLRECHLFPLPLEPYTIKYWLFALITRFF